MKHLLTLKGAIIAAAVVTLLAGGVIFGTHAAFDVNITGNVTLTVTGDPIQILSADGVTPINSGDALDFGTASLDFFGRGPVPVRGPFFVKNFSNGPVVVEVTGDLRDDIVPLFGPTVTDLKPAPGNAFTLAAPGTTGDTVRGFLGLRFLNPSAGSKQTTIIFRATETGDAVPTPIQAPPGMVSWWPGDGNASDIIDGNHGTLSEMPPPPPTAWLARRLASMVRVILLSSGTTLPLFSTTSPLTHGSSRAGYRGAPTRELLRRM